MKPYPSAADRAYVRRARYGAALFALALFGYPVIGNLVSLLQVESRLLSVPFRLLVGSLSLWVMLTLGRFRLDTWRALLLIVWVALLLRLAYDDFAANIGGADYALQFFLAGSMLPALALWKLDTYDQRRFAIAGFITASIGCLSSLLGAALGVFGESDLTALTGRLSTVALNPVSLGHLAVSGLFCGLVWWRDASASFRPVLALLMVLLLAVLTLTGSKGPALALLVGAGLWSWRRGMFTRLLLVGVPLLGAMLVSGNNPLADRIAASDEDLSTLDRLILLQDSLQQIIDQPWIGSAFVELKSGYYPHNIFLEAAMCFGVPLTAVLIAILIRGVVGSWRLLKTRNDLIALLFLQGLLSSALAGAMFGATLTWVSLGLVLGLTRARRAARATTTGLATPGNPLNPA